MPGLLLPNGSYHDSAPADEAPEQEAVDTEVALADAHEALEGGTAKEAEPAITPCVTAFTVYLMDDGLVAVSSAAWNWREPTRQPTFDEISFGAAVVQWQAQDYDVSWVDDDTAAGVLTAFTPYLTEDGRWLISANPDDPLVVDRPPTNDELIGGCAIVQRDVATQEILGPVFNQFAEVLVKGVTQSVIGSMMNIGQQAAQAKEAMAVAEKLEKDKMRRKGPTG